MNRPRCPRTTTLQLAIAVLGLSTLGSCATMVRTPHPSKRYPIDDCTDHAYFVSHLCSEEREILDWASEYPEYRSFSAMTAEHLQAIRAEAGSVDRAAAVYYDRAISDPDNRAFLEFVDARENEFRRGPPDFDDRNVLLAFVPGMFYKDVSIVGLKGEPLLDAAADANLDAELVPVKQTGTIRTNARIIRDFLAERATRYDSIIVASVSKGGGDFVEMLYEYGDEAFVDAIDVWFNIGGIVEPSPILDMTDTTWRYRVWGKTFFFFNGWDWDGLESMDDWFRYRPGALSHPMSIPDTVQVVTIIGVPLARHVTRIARPFYRRISDYGPNDGYVLLGVDQHPPGIFYPSWRNDHYFQWTLPEPRIWAFFSYAMEIIDGTT